MEKNICNIYLVRHGETDWNKLKKLQGSTDIPLNNEGRIQAKALQKQFESFKFDAVYSSDLARARETAEIVAEEIDLQVMTTPYLRERSWGTHEGQNFDELKQKYGTSFIPLIESFDYNLEELHPDLHQVESYSQAINRVLGFLTKLAQESKGKSLLVVSHGGILKGMLLYLKQHEFKNPYVNNTGYLHLEADDHHFALKSFHGIDFSH